VGILPPNKGTNRRNPLKEACVKLWGSSRERSQDLRVWGSEHISFDQLAPSVGEHVLGSRDWCGALYVVTVVHVLLAMKVRFHGIHLMSTDCCSKCEETDTLLHGLRECAASVDFWSWTSARLAKFHRTTPWRISLEWLPCPAFKIWSRPKHQATLWFLAYVFFCVIKNFNPLSAPWKCRLYAPQAVGVYQCNARLKTCRNYLSTSWAKID
jgi:hypothetical protein